MKHSTDRILTMHAGSLPRPDDLWEMVNAKARGHAYDADALAARTKSAVAEVVRKQIDSGVDSINDGEFGKSNFSNYARERIAGFEEREPKPGDVPTTIFGRDMVEFPGYFTGAGRSTVGLNPRRFFCTSPLSYKGHDAVRTDIANFRAGLVGVTEQEPFLPAVAPGTIEHWLWNEHYASDEEYLFAIADTMHEEYQAIVDAGFVLQIDDPDLADAWQIQSQMSVAEYRKFAELRIDALNHALRGIPVESVRFHVCWGSYHGPHKYDIPLEDIIDIILKANAQAYSIEASNVRHAHEWRVWQNVKLPEGKILIPGVVGHASDFVEHPELIAERLVRYASLVGRENVMAGTDCGLGTRIDGDIVWAKFEAMAEGARIASAALWP
jgi:5-methyltetrahydropteroyltriglutamate--homocysteine methyltransferase